MSRRGRHDRDKRGSGAPARPAVVTPQSLLQDAENLQQRAERRSGQEALQGFQAAADKYRAALQAGLNPDLAADASFGLAECLQSWADLQLELLQQAPDELLSQQPQHQQQVVQTAVEAYRASLQAYQQVPSSSAGSSSSQLRPDAAVNAANVLCSLAEVTSSSQTSPPVAAAAAAAGGGVGVGGPPESLQLLHQAVQLYQAALTQEEDAATLSNLGDAQVALGEAALAAQQPEAGQAAFEAALQAYQTSCSLSDSANGDDLPGLLHNWGVGLHTIGKHALEPQLKQSLLQEAASKLRSSIQFSRADPAPHNALGDVLMDAAELIININAPTATTSNSNGSNGSNGSPADSSSHMGPADGGSSGSSAPLPGPVADQVAAVIRSAVDEGFMAALTINRTNADALVGLAEAAVALAKLCWRQGDHAAAATHVNTAVGHYNSALLRPHLLGDASERADVRYNAACAAALAGQSGVAQQLLQGLAAAGVLKPDELAGDADLAGLREQLWFRELVHGLQLQQQQQ